MNSQYQGMAKKLPTTVVNEISKYATENEITQLEMAKIIDVSYATYNRFIRGLQKLRPMQYIKVMNFYNSVVVSNAANKETKKAIKAIPIIEEHDVLEVNPIKQNVEIEKEAENILKTNSIKITKEEGKITIEIFE